MTTRFLPMKFTPFFEVFLLAKIPQLDELITCLGGQQVSERNMTAGEPSIGFLSTVFKLTNDKQTYSFISSSSYEYSFRLTGFLFCSSTKVLAL